MISREPAFIIRCTTLCLLLQLLIRCDADVFAVASSSAAAIKSSTPRAFAWGRRRTFRGHRQLQGPVGDGVSSDIYNEYDFVKALSDHRITQLLVRSSLAFKQATFTNPVFVDRNVTVAGHSSLPFMPAIQLNGVTNKVKLGSGVWLVLHRLVVLQGDTSTSR